MEFSRARIRINLIHLCNRRQKQHDMGLFPFSMKEAIAIGIIRRELGFTINQNIETHFEMVCRIRERIEILMPSIHSRFWKFREELIDMIRFCEKHLAYESHQSLYR